jgi:putative hydrolase of the HAD superfamily
MIEVAENILSTYNTRINYREKEVPADKIFSKIIDAWKIANTNKDKIIEHFFEFFQRTSIVFDDTINTLHYLKSKNYKIGILTDVAYGMPRKYVEDDIRQFNDLIDVLLTSVDVGFRKPNIKGYELLAKELNADMRNMVYVGNEEKDITGANKTGMKSIFFNNKDTNINYGADYTIKSLSDLRDIL